MKYSWNRYRWEGIWTEAQRRYMIKSRRYDASHSPTGEACQRFELFELNSPTTRASGGKRLLDNYATLYMAQDAACARVPWEKSKDNKNRWELGLFAIECRKDEELQKTKPQWFDDKNRTWVVTRDGEDKRNFGSAKEAQEVAEKAFVQSGLKEKILREREYDY